MQFQATGMVNAIPLCNLANKSLASVGKIANKGNIIVSDVEGCDRYIMNKSTKQKIPIYQENNVYIMDVDFLAENVNVVGDSESPFQRQA